MLLRPIQPPVSPRQQLIQTISVPQSTMGNRTVNCAQQSSPPPRIIHQSPSLIQRETSDYMTHLIPQPSGRIPQPAGQISSVIQPQNSSSVLHRIVQQRGDPISAYNPNNRNPINSNTQNMSSTASRSRGISQMSNKRSMIVMAHHNEYLCPPSPVSIRKMEPVQRVNHYRPNSSLGEGKSNRSQSQQNIKILIETNFQNDSAQKAPKITVAHVQSNNSRSVIRPELELANSALSQPIMAQQAQQQGSFISQGHTFMPGANRGIFVDKQSHVIQNQQGPSRIVMPIHRVVHERPYSYSLDAKQLNTRFQQQSSNMEFVSNTMAKPDLIVIQPSERYLPDQPVSFNASHKSELVQQKSTQQTQTFQQMKQSEGFNRAVGYNKLSISSNTKNREQKKTRKEIYNQYYDEGEQDSSLFEAQNGARKESIYIQQNRMFFNSTMLINEMYQNQVHRAMLKMRMVQSKSRQKSLRKRNF